MARLLARTPLVLPLLLPLALGCADSSAEGDDEIGETETSTSESTSESGETETETDEGETETGDPPVEHFEVGFDVHDLTPTDAELAEELYLGGYGTPFERGPAEGVHDPIFVRSMAIMYGPEEGVIVAIVDTIGMGNQWIRAIRADVAQNTGLSEDQIIVSSTHTHGGPDFQGLWGGVPDSYRERATNEIAASMEAAWSARVPARLEVTSTTSENRNRRGWEFTDQDLVALHAVALEDDTSLGLLVGFAAHPVVLGDDNKNLSRDYCGYTVDMLEAQIERPVLFFNGIQGDVSPVVPDGEYADDFERADAYGDLVGQATLDALPNLEPVDVDFHFEHRSYVLEVQNELFKLAAQAGLLDYDFEMRGEQSFVTTQTTYLRLGNQLQLIAFPGESLTRNGLAVKDVMTAPHQMVLGLSGDSLGYFVPSDEWNTGLNDNYEETVSLGMPAGDTTRDLMIEMVQSDPWGG